ncbi:MAG: hypothetical protein RL654_3648 [Pseudomonadota bacterium]|jgi:expansin (peptidoglycan-binding protein)
MCFLAPTTRAAAALASCLAQLSPLQAHAQATPEPQQGIATHYDATGPVSCAFDLDPRERMIAAMNEAQYGQADWCGAQVRVEGPRRATASWCASSTAARNARPGIWT